MFRRLAAGLLCLALLGGCAPIDVNIEDLLRPPWINERQIQVQQALSTHVDLARIHYQYPRAGDYRSPFVFSDMDGDGLMEAVVFFTSAETQGAVRMKTLREEADGSWLLIDDRAGFGDRVHIVWFSNLLSTGSQSLLVGWEDSVSGRRRLDVFSYQGGELSVVYQTDYTIFDIDHYKMDELEQIALVRQDAAGLHQLHLLGRTVDGRLSIVGEAALSTDTSEVVNLSKGLLREGTNGIFVDARRHDFLMSTELFAVADNSLVILAADIEIDVINTLYRQTFRPFRQDGSLLSRDLRGDGRVVIPVHSLDDLPAPDIESELDPLPLTLYLSYDFAGQLLVTDMAVVNPEAGYLFFFPEEWVNRVSVSRRPEIGQWRFYEIDPVTNQPAAELLRIRVQQIRGYHNDQTDNYILLAERGLSVFHGYLPAGNSPLALTQSQMQNNFMLL
ncbi:MAG: hypothetical protein FWE32_10755 [Oscillospiraceae bacterium]|nr:hypothetical protein [Oscillospiraceae bacterium]